MPLCIDLFCGLGGWTEGFLAEGWDVVGFDIERHQYGEQRYPGRLVLADVLGLWGSQFRHADCIVASPPCQKYSYMAMPWSRAKALAAWYREIELRQLELTALFDACFRIQREACEAAGRYIPIVVENVKGAQPWVGKAKANFGSFYFWGDVQMVGGAVVAGRLEFGRVARAARRGSKRNPDGTNHPQGSWFAVADSKDRGTKNAGGSWFDVAHNTESGTGQNPVNGRKVSGIDFNGYGTPGYKAQAFNSTAAQRYRHEQGNGSKGFVTGLGMGHDWRQDPSARFNSKSDSRKAASAQIAKIPFPLASYIARAFKPGRA